MTTVAYMHKMSAATVTKAADADNLNTSDDENYHSSCYKCQKDITGRLTIYILNATSTIKMFWLTRRYFQCPAEHCHTA